MQFSLPRPSALLIVSALVVLGLAAIVPVRAQSQQETAGDAIVATALTYVGTWQGDCWPWVRRVVEEATGSQMGFGYRDGFFEGGAVEVSIAEARPGDVIQMADDNNNGPGAFYSGLHTAIVYKVHGDGVFTVLDSNSKWDGMVRIRENYDTTWAAGRYANITARVYRFGAPDGATGTIPPPVETPEPQDVDFGVGDTIRVNTPGSCLNFRNAANGASVIRCVAHGTTFTVLSGPVAAGSHTWVEVETADGERGWVAVQFVELVDPTPVPDSSAPPAPLDTPPVGHGGEGDDGPIGGSSLPHRLVAPALATDE